MLTAGEGVVGAHRFPLIGSSVVDVDLPVACDGTGSKLGREGGVDVSRYSGRRGLEVHLVLAAQCKRNVERARGR